MCIDGAIWSSQLSMGQQISEYQQFKYLNVALFQWECDVEICYRNQQG